MCWMCIMHATNVQLKNILRKIKINQDSPKTMNCPVVDTLRDLTESLVVQRLQGRKAVSRKFPPCHTFLLYPYFCLLALCPLLSFLPLFFLPSFFLLQLPLFIISWLIPSTFSFFPSLPPYFPSNSLPNPLLHTLPPLSSLDYLVSMFFFPVIHSFGWHNGAIDSTVTSSKKVLEFACSSYMCGFPLDTLASKDVNLG